MESHIADSQFKARMLNSFILETARQGFVGIRIAEIIFGWKHVYKPSFHFIFHVLFHLILHYYYPNGSQYSPNVLLTVALSMVLLQQQVILPAGSFLCPMHAMVPDMSTTMTMRKR